MDLSVRSSISIKPRLICSRDNEQGRFELNAVVRWGANALGVPLSILLVEDDEDDYLLIKDLLDNIEGYAISLVWEPTHRGGLNVLLGGQFDLCLVDYRIGAETGVDFISDASGFDLDTPIILTTGVSDRSIDVEASAAGAVDYIEKSDLTCASLERAIRYSMARLQHSRLRRVHSDMTRSELEHELRQAIADRQFEVYLQPEVHCETLQIKKAEALVRWNHPTRGTLGPHHFIEVAEQSGLIIGIGKCVIEQVCQISNRLNAISNRITLAFNVSVAQMERLDFADTVRQALVAHNTDPSTIEIEITESVAMREPKLVRAHLDALKSFGIRLAVDDFGTGHSSLATLKEFPFDIIKIDRAFVQSAEQSMRNRAIAKTIFYLADVLRLETVAEGIETEAHFSFVKNYGATYAQGYLFSKPLPFDEFQVFAHRFNWSKASQETRAAS